MFVGITKHYVYGFSANELAPLATNCTKTAELIDVETKEEALNIMSEKVLPLRREAEKHCKSYSCPDGYDWEVIEIS